MTKKQRVLNHLKSGKSITSMEAITLYGVTRLAAVIHTLKTYEGHNIDSENVKGKNGNYALYKMRFEDPPVISMFKKDKGILDGEQASINMTSYIGYRVEE